MKEVWNKPYPEVTTERVNLRGAEFIPKPPASDIPVLVTGFSGQSLEWIAENGNGWISFPRNPEEQRKIVESFRSLTDEFKQIGRASCRERGNMTQVDNTI